MPPKTCEPLLSSVGPQKWSLRELKWLPVVRDGQRQRIDLERALSDAHHIERLEIASPLAESATLRFLSTMSAYMVRELALEVPVHREVLESGLPAEGVRGVLDRIDARLWLVHPERPFMQEARYAQTEPNRSAPTIDPAQAGPSTKLWFGSNVEQEPLAPEDAVLALLTYWFFSPNSNSRPAVLGEPLRAAGSVIGSSAMNSGVRASIEGANLLETMLGNAPRAWLESREPPAYLRDSTSTLIQDPLDVATATGNAVLLFRGCEEGPFTLAAAGGALREGLPMDAQTRAARAEHSKLRAERTAEIKAVKARNAARKKAAGKGADPDALGLETVPDELPPFPSPYDVFFDSLKAAGRASHDLVTVTRLARDGAPDTANSPRPLAGFTFGANVFDDFAALFDDRSIRMPQGPWLARASQPSRRFFEVNYRSATTPLFESAHWHASGTALLQLDDDVRFELGGFARELRQLRRLVRLAIGRGLDDAAKPGKGTLGIMEELEDGLSTDLAPIVEAAIEAARRESPLDDDTRARMHEIAIDAVALALRPYQSVARTKDIATAISSLRRDLATRKEPRP